MESDDTWGQLVSLTEIESSPIPLQSSTFKIGRALDCDLSFSDNKLVSGHHCCIERDEKSGAVFLCDSSTNGTLLNLEYKISKGQRKELKHGDEIYVVYKKNNEELNVGFMYQDCEELQKEEGTQEYSPPDLLDATLEDTDCNHVSPDKPAKKRKSTEDANSCTEDAGPSKKLKQETEPNIEAKVDKDQKNKSEPKVEESKSIPVKDQSQAESDKPCDKADEQKTGEDKSSSAEKLSSSAVKSVVPERDDIEENLQCMICQEIMHDCISLQPCLHSFCAGCYSDWMARSSECPSCRKKVERINKNHIVNNLIEAYLKNHPEKKRPSEDIEDLNKKNKITNDMLYPVGYKKNSSSEYEDSTPDENSDDEPVAAPAPYYNPQPVFAPAAQALFGFGTPVFGVQRAFKTVCRQCPGYMDPNAASNSAGTGVIGGIKTALNTVKSMITGEGTTSGTPAGTEPVKEAGETGEPSTSGSGEPDTTGAGIGPTTAGADGKPYKDDPKEMPTAPCHSCPAIQNHVLCQCCLQPTPDFRLNWPFADVEKRPQQCAMCYRSYCHAYWGCKKHDCLGCLNKFKDMNFGRKSLVGIILENQYESEIFKDYIDKHGLSVKDVLQECCRQMEAGKFTAQAQGTHGFKSDTPVCYACGLNQFKQLAFQYRKTWKKEDLPGGLQRKFINMGMVQDRLRSDRKRPDDPATRHKFQPHL